MNPTEREFPPCGYGLLGLCCSDCLEGPCRLSPFEREKEKGRCGIGPDLLAARNLLRLVLREGGLALHSLRRALEESRNRIERNEVLPESEKRRIADAYGLTPGLPANALAALLGDEAERLLSSSRTRSSLMAAFYAEKIFPRIQYPDGVSLFADYLDLAVLPDKTDGTAPLFERALQSALLYVAGEELARDLHLLIHQPAVTGLGKALRDVPVSPLPVLVSLSRESSLRFERVIKTLEEKKFDFFPAEVAGTGELLRFIRRLNECWRRPAESWPVAIVAESAHVLDILTPLALGFAVISSPSLPISGSEQASSFFSTQLRNKLGNFYMDLTDEEALSSVSDFLTGRKP